jgi:hypothetical protein
MICEVAGVEDDVVEFVVVVEQTGGLRGRHILLKPCGDSFDFGVVVGFRIVVALDPAANLPRQITFWLAKLAQAGGGIVDLMEPN